MSDPNCPKCHGHGEYPAVSDWPEKMVKCDCRISRNQMLMMMASIAAERSTCNRKKVGAVIANEGRVISIGYGGAPSRLPHCIDVGCLIGPDGGCIRTTHAEANAISFAARQGIATENATLLCTLSPCYNCAKIIINAGILFVYYREKYRDSSGIDLLKLSGIPAVQHA